MSQATARSSTPLGLLKAGGISSGLAGLIGLLALAATVPSPQLFLQPMRVVESLADPLSQIRYVVHFGLLALAGLAGVLGMYTLHRALQRRFGVLSLGAFALIAAGLLVFSYGSLMNVLVFPRLGAQLAAGTVSVADIFPIPFRTQEHTFLVVSRGGLAFLAGLLLFSILLLPGDVLPTWVGLVGIVAVVIHVGMIVLALRDVLPPIGSTWGYLPQLPESPLAIWFVLVGFGLFRLRRSPETAPPNPT